MFGTIWSDIIQLTHTKNLHQLGWLKAEKVFNEKNGAITSIITVATRSKNHHITCILTFHITYTVAMSSPN